MHFTPVVYARLLIDQLLPAGIDRVIYLDSDLYVRAPLEDLAATDLQGRPAGAVLDLDRHRIMLGRDLRQNHDLFDFHYRYFNSGIMVIDRTAYGAADLRARTIDLFANGTLPRVQHDQIIPNLVFRDNWTPLDFRWNLISPSPAHEALEPFIIHYTGHRKPWTLRSQAAYAGLSAHHDQRGLLPLLAPAAAADGRALCPQTSGQAQMSGLGSSPHVALTFNDLFWAPAYATIRSVCLTTRHRADIVSTSTIGSSMPSTGRTSTTSPPNSAPRSITRRSRPMQR